MKQKIYFAKYCLLKHKTLSKYRQVMKEQYLDAETLHKLNWERTKAIVTHAYENAPFYRQRFNKIDFHPKDLKNETDFEQLPPLTRADIQNNTDNIIASGYTKKMLNKITTGGSTGEPLTVYHPKDVARITLLWRMLSWWGLKPGVNMATIYRETESLKKRLINKAIGWPVSVLQLNAANYGPKEIEEFVAQFNRSTPVLLHGYVGAVDDIASYILKEKIKTKPPKAIWVTSAPLSSVQEARIQKAFGAPVCDQYGSCEVFYSAAECSRKEGLHMFSDVQRIDFLKDNFHSVQVGKLGQIALTDFDNYAFPLIRYLNGDYGRRLTQPCSCGRTLPLMDKVSGRISERLIMPSGRRVSGEYMTTIFDDYPELVERFQVYQGSDYNIAIRVVCRLQTPETLRILERIKGKVGEQTSHEVDVKIVFVTKIPTYRGKLRFVVSDASH